VPQDRADGQQSGGPIGGFTDLLRSEIVSGVFSPHERLVEADLAARYRVSRGTARAALAELTKEGLVERQLNRGARVRALSPEEATELSEARFAIEGLCAGYAACNATSDEVAELRALLAEMEQAAKAHDIIFYYDLVGQLVQRIRAFSRHRSAAALAEQLLNRLAPYSAVDSLAPGRINASLKEFEAIVDGIAQADPEAAEAAVRAHRIAVAAARRDVASRVTSLRPFRQSLAGTTSNLSSLSGPSRA
jgi:DNA-binding GntR family transcriptional regulator